MSSLSIDHRRSLISAPIQTVITAAVSFVTVYYLVRFGDLDALGLWAIGNLAILYGGALVLGAHQRIARHFAQGEGHRAISGLRSFSGSVFIVSALAVVAIASLSLIPKFFGTINPLSVIVLVLAGSFWTLGLLARGPALYLGQFSQSNLLEASSAVLAFLLTVLLTQFFGVGALQIWLPFLVRSLSLFLGLLFAARRHSEIVEAFAPRVPNVSEAMQFLRSNAGTSALWLATSSRMVVLRTFFGAVLGPAALGLLDVAMRVPTLLVNGVSSGNQTLLVGLSAALRIDDSGRITSLLFGLAQILILINLPLLFGYAAYADVMFQILVGSDIEQLTLLTWLTTAWVGVTAVNQIAFWIVQSAGLESRQALAYALHTALFLAALAMALVFNIANPLNLVFSFASAGIVAETTVLWSLALTLEPFRTFLRSSEFQRAYLTSAVAAVSGFAAVATRNVEQLGHFRYLAPALLVLFGWLVNVRLLTDLWPHSHVSNLRLALERRRQR